ncbi:hypothetical protein WG66_013458, partial [Moniliophthora roreri]
PDFSDVDIERRTALKKSHRDHILLPYNSPFIWVTVSRSSLCWNEPYSGLYSDIVFSEHHVVIRHGSDQHMPCPVIHLLWLNPDFSCTQMTSIVLWPPSP